MKSSKSLLWMKAILFLIILGWLPSTALSATSHLSYIDVQVDWDSIHYDILDLETRELTSIIPPDPDQFYSRVEAWAGPVEDSDEEFADDTWAELMAEASHNGAQSGAYTDDNGYFGVSLTVGMAEASSEAEVGQRFTVSSDGLLMVEVPIIFAYDIDSWITEHEDDAQIYIGLWNETQNRYNQTGFGLEGIGNDSDNLYTLIPVANGDVIWLYADAELGATANPVPIPSALLLLGSGFAGVMILKRKRG